MAKRLNEFDFGSKGNTYDWDAWSDGGIWELTRGEDYHSKNQTIAQQARKWAKANGFKVKVSAPADSG